MKSKTSILPSACNRKGRRRALSANAPGRLSRLSVWFVRLGITPEFIEPSNPYQNGKHENMHLVLKRQATRPLRANHFELRRVSKNGGIRWHNHWVNVSSPLSERYVGLEEVDLGLLRGGQGPDLQQSRPPSTPAG